MTEVGEITSEFNAPVVTVTVADAVMLLPPVTVIMPLPFFAAVKTPEDVIVPMSEGETLNVGVKEIALPNWSTPVALKVCVAPEITVAEDGESVMDVSAGVTAVCAVLVTVVLVTIESTVESVSAVSTAFLTFVKVDKD